MFSSLWRRLIPHSGHVAQPASSLSDSLEEVPGTENIDGYTVVQVVMENESQHTKIYKVHKKGDADKNRFYAAKLINRMEESKEDQDILPEVAFMKTLNHKNVLGLIEHRIMSPTQDCIIMDWYDKSLNDFLSINQDLKRSRGSFKKTSSLLLQMIDAFEYLTSVGVFHRDIKTSNMMVREEGDELQLVVMDFGISKNLKEGEQTYTCVGTSFYVPPERSMNYETSYSNKSDSWALGIVLWQIGCGFSEDIMRSHIQQAFARFYPDQYGPLADRGFDFTPSLIVTNDAYGPGHLFDLVVESKMPAWLMTLVFSLLRETPDDRVGLSELNQTPTVRFLRFLLASTSESGDLRSGYSDFSQLVSLLQDFLFDNTTIAMLGHALSSQDHSIIFKTLQLLKYIVSTDSTLDRDLMFSTLLEPIIDAVEHCILTLAHPDFNIKAKGVSKIETMRMAADLCGLARILSDRPTFASRKDVAAIDDLNPVRITRIFKELDKIAVNIFGRQDLPSSFEFPDLSAEETTHNKDFCQQFGFTILAVYNFFSRFLVSLVSSEELEAPQRALQEMTTRNTLLVCNKLEFLLSDERIQIDRPLLEIVGWSLYASHLSYRSFNFRKWNMEVRCEMQHLVSLLTAKNYGSIAKPSGSQNAQLLFVLSQLLIDIFPTCALSESNEPTGFMMNDLTVQNILDLIIPSSSSSSSSSSCS
eukprot:TRINITY_DN1362_c1_g1_i1.p1 TRINITY_DN1362_c1_g1~~TRINITY_DN1362_c1_g1_i1.p1  ORF type:complete len:729 (-),score=311.85 TRINITY_DN1362_c1_g1_i1:43-2142(-)